MPLFDALQFVKDYSIPYEIESNNSAGWVNIPCPMCGREDYKGGLNSRGGYFHCWVCGSTHIVKAISTMLQIPYPKAKEVYQEYEGFSSLRVGRESENRAKATHIDLPGELLNKYHRKYLAKRDFDPDYLEAKYGLRGTGPGVYWNKADFSKRIIIPFYNKYGELVSFQGRDYTNKTDLRYKGAPLDFCRANYKDLLYNIQNCKGSCICVLEGAPDVWRMGDGFVATFGISYTKKQVRLLTKYKKVFIMFDPEPEAQRQAYKLGVDLGAMGIDVENIIMDTGGRDAGELSEEEAQEIRYELGFS